MMMRDRGHGVRTKVQGSRFQVSSPYDKEFALIAHHLGGRWRSRSRMWSFPKEKYGQIAQQLNRIYGTDLPHDGKPLQPLEPPYEGAE